MSYPGIDESEIPPAFEPTPNQPFPPVAETVAQTVPDSGYGGDSWSAPRQFDFIVPSGAKCRLRKVDVEEALNLGLINHLDVFSPQLMKNDQGRNRSPQEVQAEFLKKIKDSDGDGDFFTTITAVVLAAVVKPELVDTDPSEPLPPGIYSIRNVKLKDKMAIFHRALGEDLEKIQQFREGQEDVVGTVESGKGVQHKAKRSNRNSARKT
jgi:hypothetical protein